MILPLVSTQKMGRENWERRKGELHLTLVEVPHLCLLPLTPLWSHKASLLKGIIIPPSSLTSSTHLRKSSVEKNGNRSLQKSGSIQVQCIIPLTKSCTSIESGLMVSLELHFVHLFKRRSSDVEVRSKEKFELPLLQ